MPNGTCAFFDRNSRAYLLLDAQVGASDGVWVGINDFLYKTFTLNQIDAGNTVEVRVSNGIAAADGSVGPPLNTEHGTLLLDPLPSASGEMAAADNLGFRYVKARKIGAGSLPVTVIMNMVRG